MIVLITEKLLLGCFRSSFHNTKRSNRFIIFTFIIILEKFVFGSCHFNVMNGYKLHNVVTQIFGDFGHAEP